MSIICWEYEDFDKLMFELVFVFVKDWIGCFDEEIIEVIMGEFKKLFLIYFSGDNFVILCKYKVVKMFLFVYKMIFGCQELCLD